MEGARTWDRRLASTLNTPLATLIHADTAKIPTHAVQVSDPNPTIHPDRNPLQPGHSPAETEAIAAHLKRSLEDVVVAIFNAAKSATPAADPAADEPLQIRWVEAYFPFTSPSWELEVFWQGDWLEVLGCGIVQQGILDGAGVPHRVGWAFGMGLERIAMLLYGIPDIRLFWSTDARFLGQFRADKAPRRFVPFSRFPACFKDVSFWLPAAPETHGNAAGGAGGEATDGASFHENDVMEIARDVCGDVVEDVRLTDEFTNKKGRRSMCYRVNYRHLERTLTNDEANDLHARFREQLVEKLGVELR